MPTVIVDNPFDETDETTMVKVFRKFTEAIESVLWIDDSTNRLSKPGSISIAHSPNLHYTECLRSNLSQEITANMVKKIDEVITYLNSKTKIKSVSSSVSKSCNETQDVC